MNNYFNHKAVKTPAKGITEAEKKSLILKDPSLIILNFEDLQDIFLEEKISLADYIENPVENSFNIRICSLDDMIAVYASQAKPAFFAISNQNLK